MESSDRMIVVIGGREYFIEGDTLRPSQSSFEQEVLKRLDKIETRLDGIEARVGALETGQQVLTAKVEGLNHSVYWVLAVIGLYLAILTLPPYIAGLFRKWTGKEEKPSPAPVHSGLSAGDVLALIDDKLAHYTPKETRQEATKKAGSSPQA